MRRDWQIGGWVFVGLMIAAIGMVVVSVVGHVLQFFGML